MTHQSVCVGGGGGDGGVLLSERRWQSLHRTRRAYLLCIAVFTPPLQQIFCSPSVPQSVCRGKPSVCVCVCGSSHTLRVRHVRGCVAQSGRLVFRRCNIRAATFDELSAPQPWRRWTAPDLCTAKEKKSVFSFSHTSSVFWVAGTASRRFKPGHVGSQPKVTGRRFPLCVAAPSASSGTSSWQMEGFSFSCAQRRRLTASLTCVCRSQSETVLIAGGIKKNRLFI